MDAWTRVGYYNTGLQVLILSHQSEQIFPLKNLLVFPYKVTKVFFKVDLWYKYFNISVVLPNLKVKKKYSVK